jgi:hypothetical protein
VAVPITAPAWVRFSSVLAARAMPKSVTRTWPDPSTMTLPGFTSRCTTPWRWAKAKAEATSAPMAAARSARSGPSARMMLVSVAPSTYSMTMNDVPSSSPKS